MGGGGEGKSSKVALKKELGVGINILKVERHQEMYTARGEEGFKLKRIYLKRMGGRGWSVSQSHSFSLVRSFFPIHEHSLCAPKLIFCHTEIKKRETEEQDGFPAHMLWLR